MLLYTRENSEGDLPMGNPQYFYNTETGKQFQTEGIVRKDSGFAEVRINESNVLNGDRGAAVWEIQNRELLLHTLESHPEAKSGLGPLLMYWMAKEGQKNNCELIHILSAALDKRDFYFYMGCDYDMKSLYGIRDGFLAEKYDYSIANIMVGQCPLSGTPREIAEGARRSVVKRWRKVDLT